MLTTLAAANLHKC